MTKTAAISGETEHIARAIMRCYSKATIAVVAAELGCGSDLKADIFRALIIAKVAQDFDSAVRLVADHLDAGAYVPQDTIGLSDGKIERRATSRQPSK